MNGLPPGMLSWTSSEAATVNEFLNSAVGKKWLAVLLNRKPRVDLTSTERAALSGALVAGYENFFTEIAATRVGGIQPENLSAKSIDMIKD